MTPCPTGKRGYPSIAAGREANIRNGKRLRFYECPSCGLWHGTHTAAEGRGKTERNPK